MKSRGQNVTEFAIIIALVSIASIFVLTLLGGNITSLLQNSETKVDNFDPFNVRASGGSTSATYSTSTPSTDPVVNTSTVSGYSVDEHADGSYSFDVGGQTVNISKEVLDNYNTVLQTTGASGLEDLVSELAYLYSTEPMKSAIAGGEPVNIKFGSSEREGPDAYGDYEGSASVNSTTIIVGDHVTMLVNDQAYDKTNTYMGKYRIEGTIDPVTKQFTGAGADISYISNATTPFVYPSSTTPPAAYVSVPGTYDQSTETFIIKNDKIYNNHPNGDVTANISWDIEFK